MATAAKSREELELEKAVFGDQFGFESELARLGMDEDLDDGNNDESDENDNNEDEDSELFFIDKEGEQGSEAGNKNSHESNDEDVDVKVWHDSDSDIEVDLTATNRTKKLRKSLDEAAVSGNDYELRLRAHFEKLYPKPKWAQTKQVSLYSSSDIENDEDVDLGDAETTKTSTNPLKDVLNQTTSYLTKTKLKMLPTSDIDIQRLADITKQRTSQSVVQSAQFHPTRPLMLIAGFDKTLRIYQVDGKVNPIVSSLYIENCPFRTALFHPDGKRVFAGGRRRYLYIWNLETGSVENVSRMYGHEHTQNSFEKFVISPCGEYLALIGDNGWMNILSTQSGQWIDGAKVEGKLVDLAWTDKANLTLVNSRGDVWHWDINSRRFSSRWRDPSLVGVTCLAQTAKWIALGMESGMVAIYDRLNPNLGMRMTDAEPESWEPSGVVENLVTSISDMKFSPDGQMLVISSKLKRDALRIVHISSFSVFKNWPTSSTPLGHVSSVAWSPQNQMLAAGNEGGHVRLWSLNHYS